MCATLRPAGESSLENGKNGVETDAHRSEDKKTRKCQRHIEVRTRYHHHVAYALVGGNGLRHDCANEGESDRNLERSKQVGQRARKADVPENVQLLGLQDMHD